MKELVVMATLITLGFATESSFAYVLGESCRLIEDLDDMRLRANVVTVAALPNNIGAMELTARH